MLEGKNVAYKAIPFGDGVIFLFDLVDNDSLGKEVPRIKVENSNVFVLLGDNAIRVDNNIFKELQAAPRVVLAKCEHDSYHPDYIVGGCEFNQMFLAKLEGVLECTLSST